MLSCSCAVLSRISSYLLLFCSSFRLVLSIIRAKVLLVLAFQTQKFCVSRPQTIDVTRHLGHLPRYGVPFRRVRKGARIVCGRFCFRLAFNHGKHERPQRPSIFLTPCRLACTPCQAPFSRQGGQGHQEAQCAQHGAAGI